MSHIDEGVLHAYLDGEAAALTGPDGRPLDPAAIERHLAECAECHGRLAEARRVRDRAASILDTSGPAVSPPPFAEVVARARSRSRGRRVLQLNRLTALGWAAVVVLAVGVGWIAREAVGFREAEPGVAPGTEATPAELAQQPGPRAAESPTLTDADQRRSPEAATGQPVSPPAAQAEPQAPGRGEGAIAQATPPIAEAEEAAAAPSEPNEVPAAAPSALEPADTRVAQQPDAAERFADAAAPAEARARAEEAPQAGVAARRLQAAADAEWAVADQETAEDHVGGPLLTVPDLPVIAVRVGRVDGTPAVRVVQQLPAGDSLELLQLRVPEGDRDAAALRQDVDQAAALARIAGRETGAQWVVVRRGYAVSGRAGIPPDSLRQLLERIP
jgi:anti-sigma factor RsiW